MAIKDVYRTFPMQRLTGIAASTALTIPTVQSDYVTSFRPVLALLQAQVASVIWTSDGTAASATNGFILNPSDPPYPVDCDLTQIRVIQGAAGAVLMVGYFA